MRHFVRLEQQDFAVALIGPRLERRLLLDDLVLDAELQRHHGTQATVRVDGVVRPIHLAVAGDRVLVWLDGEVFDAAVLEPLALYAGMTAAASGLEARAPMPGCVVALPVAVGDIVRAGETLVVIESMKLEVNLRATSAGRVVAISCDVGRNFDKDAVLVLLAAHEGGEHAATD
jgi:acetyl-CoA/propionyl-CoA carboxylase biotin carboxyl carrier protein